MGELFSILNDKKKLEPWSECLKGMNNPKAMAERMESMDYDSLSKNQLAKIQKFSKLLSTDEAEKLVKATSNAVYQIRNFVIKLAEYLEHEKNDCRDIPN